MKLPSRGITASLRSLPTWATAVLVAGLVLASAPSRADPFPNPILGTVSPTNGFIGGLFGPDDKSYLVAGAGEAPFKPFGSLVDALAGLDLSGVGDTWTQASDSDWTSLGNQTWILPEPWSTNEDDYGHFISPTPWSSSILGPITGSYSFVILESPGIVSDVIDIYNDSAGNANLLFGAHNGPFVVPVVPEPGTVALTSLGLAVISLALARRRRKNSRRSA
jgi:PEP-CTERM motif